MTTEYKIGRESVSGQLQTRILARAFKESEMKSIWDSYKNARVHGRESTPPTDLQKSIASYKKKTGKTTREIAEHFKTNPSAIHTAINKVAVFEYLNN